VRDLFDQGKKHAPCIIFMDEIDAVVGTGARTGRRPRRARADPQPAPRGDGRLETNEGVILIAATNRPDVLDPALLRSGTISTARCGGAPRRSRAARDPRVHARRYSPRAKSI